MSKLANILSLSRIPKTTVSIQKLNWFLTAWFALAYNIPFFKEIWVALGYKSVTILMLYCVMVCCLLLLNLLLVNIISIKGIYKPIVIFLFLISTLLFYSNLTGKQYNPFAFEFNEWIAGAGKFLTLNFAFTLLFLFIIPSAVLVRTNILWGATKMRLLKITSYVALTSLLLISFYRGTENKVQAIYETTRASLSKAIPMHFFDSSVKYIKNQYFNPIHSFTILDKQPIILPKSRHKTLILIVSESIRADIFKQYLATIHFTNKVHNSDIKSCNTFGGSSLQCIFSFLPADKFNESRALHQQNVIDLLSLSGVNIYWLTNQKGCGSLCTRASVHEVSLKCETTICNDLALADNLLAETLLTINPEQSNLIVLQTRNIASPLYSRFYPKEYALQIPECNSIIVSSCSDIQLTNSYHNAMLYVSVILEHAVNHLAQFKLQHSQVSTALVFTSKYGESLGEHGYYFHGSPKAIAPIEQVLVPLLIIDENLPVDCLSTLQMKRSYDVISHTLLGQFKIQTNAYKPELDLLEGCSIESKNGTS